MIRNKRVNVSTPMWLLRLAPNKLSFLQGNGIDFDADRVRMTLDDLDRRSSQVLVWTE